MTRLVLKNCRLVNELVEGYDLPYADILLENGKIGAIRPTGFAFGDLPYMDAENQTLLPGLIDLHVHLMFTNQDYPAMLQRSSYQYLLDCISHAKVLLKQGYTTVRDCGSQDGAGVAMRDAVAQGIIKGPRIITSGHCVTPTTRGNDGFGKLYMILDKPEDAMHICRKELESGVDFIKLMATGSVLNVGGEPGALIITPEEIRALTKAAEFHGTYVAAHCHGKGAILECIKNGVKTIEHGTYLDEDVIDAILEHGNDVAIIGTYAVVYSLMKNFTGTVPEEFIQKTKKIMETYGVMGKLAYERGVQFGWGSDLDEYTRANYVGLEFMARADQGFDNLALLRQATIESAKIIGMDHEIGSIKEGKIADLILVKGEPDNDISVMQNLPTHVFRAGVEYKD